MRHVPIVVTELKWLLFSPQDIESGRGDWWMLPSEFPSIFWLRDDLSQTNESREKIIVYAWNHPRGAVCIEYNLSAIDWASLQGCCTSVWSSGKIEFARFLIQFPHGQCYVLR